MLKDLKRDAKRIPGWGVATLTLGVVALVVALGVARWSWLILDEQIRLREEFMELKGRQEQVEIQYEFWLNELREERKASSGRAE